jgi:hypothetical protein
MEQDRAARWHRELTLRRLYQLLTGQRLTPLLLTFPLTNLPPTRQMSPFWEPEAQAVSLAQAEVAGQPEARPEAVA